AKYFSFRSKDAQRLYVFLITLAFIVGILSYTYTPSIEIELGKPSPRTIKANKSIEFEDVEKTQEDIRRNVASVEDVYSYDPDILNGEEGTLYQIRYFFQLSRVVQKKEDKSFEEKIDYLVNLLGSQYPASIVSACLQLSVEEINFLMNKTQDIARQVMSEEIKPTEVDFAKSKAQSLADNDSEIKPEQKYIVKAVLQKTIQPTAVFDPQATEKAREEARLNTPPHMVVVTAGQTIISEGEIVGEDDILVLRKLGLLESGFKWDQFLYIFFISSAILLLFGFYIYKFEFKVYRNVKKLVIISMLLVLFTAIARLFTILSSIHLNFWNYLFPVMAASMLSTIIFDVPLGLLMTICLSVFSGIVANFDFNIILAYMTGGIFATYLVSNVSQRSQVMRAGFISSLILGFSFLTVNLIRGELAAITFYAVLGVINGIICAIITIGFLPFIESSFNIVTAMGLLELSHTDQPLLKELLLSAPGTYNHSLLVGHLAESCAKAIGADSLLVKVAALYHDLGKMKKPEYFYENQMGIENIHDRINPSLSRTIIANHIKDGIEIAIKNKIPKRVVEIISQHHGNSLITYFYKKQKDKEATKEPNGGLEALEGLFRYPSKKPQSKEAAILMLADSTEAAVRSIEKVTPKRIDQMVNDIVKGKIEDKQLDEADITLKEINIVKNTLIDGLISIYHSRISYPEQSLKVVSE
ncbi:MAG: HDIG domain-containing protein, partial [Actinobacteria bacterium]|nr:HDIG domain-containing protein [Actinomycetota bacterium]